MIYFFSYARADATPFLKRFYDDLREAVRSKTGKDPDTVGFRDVDSIQPGTEWPPNIVNALSTCDVFVYIHSPTYFNRDGCGREFEIIRQRLRSNKISRNPGVFPIYWDGEKVIEGVPREVSEIQLTHDSFPPEYNARGMLLLTKTGHRTPPYELAVNEFAERIAHAAKNCPLPTLGDIPIWSKVKPFFSTNDNNQNFTVSSLNKLLRSPRNVRFIWIVGTREELRSERSIECYDEEGIAEEWRLFFPETVEPGRLIASDAARSANLTYIVDDEIIGGVEVFRRKIDDLADQYVPLVVVIDAWSLSLERYRNAVQVLDRRNFDNCLVIVPRNMLDSDTARKGLYLDQLLARAFPLQYYKSNSYVKFKQANNLASFKSEIQNSLVRYVGDIDRSLKAARALPEFTSFAELPQLTAVRR